MSIDIIVASQSQFDDILQDVNNRLPLDVIHGADVSIDDVVTIVAVYRNAINDRAAWWKIRREVYARFSNHAEITTRTLAFIPDQFRDEIANFSAEDISLLAGRWLEHEGSSPTSLEEAKRSLHALAEACRKAASQSSAVFLRTNQPPNAFELAFSTQTGKSLANYRRVYDKLDETQKYEAHQKFNYYNKQGLENSLELVLRDLTRKGTKKINLKTDQKKIQRHILKCVKDYCRKPGPVAGSPDAPITLIMLTFDIEYEGYIDFVFDTRDEAISHIQWEERTEGCLDLGHWNEAALRLSVNELPLDMILLDGSRIVISPESGDDAFEAYVGQMLRDTLLEARNGGVFSRLPLANPCYMLVGGTHANYAWPADMTFGPECVANV